MRACKEELNGVVFSGSEWKQFFDGCLSNGNDGPDEKTERPCDISPEPDEARSVDYALVSTSERER
ncbi:MAG: hypothetical protein IJ087_08040 [Eggerthellaceae bacterium]|nr:hypothetical protein [Eggerthellaceae bacterium]